MIELLPLPQLIVMREQLLRQLHGFVAHIFSRGRFNQCSDIGLKAQLTLIEYWF